VAQGFKNTHNRFGSIDFKALKRDIRDNLGVEIGEDPQTVTTYHLNIKRV